jgi:amino acid transporter
MATAAESATTTASAKKLGVFTLAMISVAAVLSVRNFPSMAPDGWSLIFWYLLGTIFFLIPCALVGAELATGWPKDGGLYAWVQEAFGSTWGGIAIWAVFAQNLVWYPTVLSINPDLGNNPWYNLIVMLAVFWGATLFNFLGPNASARLSSIGTLAGSIVPAALLIVLGIAYIAAGNPSQLPPFSWDHFFPTWNLSTLVFASSIPLMFAGMEMAGYQATNARNINRDFPLAMYIASAIIFFISVFGTLPIAMVVPPEQLSLNGGIMQTFQIMLAPFGLSWLVPIVAILLALGGIALMSTWMLGPTLGMVPLAREGKLPQMFGDLNRNGVPTKVLILQAVIGSILALAMVLIPSMNAAYWLLSALTTLCLCVEYLPMFAAVIRLRYSQPDTPRAYKLPGGTLGAWIIAGVGFAAITFTFVVALFPPDGMNVATWAYMLFMLVGTVLLCMWPLIFQRRAREREQPAPITGEPSVAV